MMSLRLRDFVQMASDMYKLCGFYSGFNGCSRGVLFGVKHAPNSENDSSEVDNCLEKMHFVDLVKDAKSIVGLSPSCQNLVGQNDVT